MLRPWQAGWRHSAARGCGCACQALVCGGAWRCWVCACSALRAVAMPEAAAAPPAPARHRSTLMSSSAASRCRPRGAGVALSGLPRPAGRPRPSSACSCARHSRGARCLAAAAQAPAGWNMCKTPPQPIPQNAVLSQSGHGRHRRQPPGEGPGTPQPLTFASCCATPEPV